MLIGAYNATAVTKKIVTFNTVFITVFLGAVRVVQEFPRHG